MQVRGPVWGWGVAPLIKVTCSCDGCICRLLLCLCALPSPSRPACNTCTNPSSYCNKKFLPSKLAVHLRFFCGPDAKKSDALAKQQKKRKSGCSMQQQQQEEVEEEEEEEVATEEAEVETEEEAGRWGGCTVGIGLRVSAQLSVTMRRSCRTACPSILWALDFENIFCWGGQERWGCWLLATSRL